MIQSADRFGTTWWGALWIQGLQKLSDDYENRLPRGKSYALHGSVSHFQVRPGEIEAKVQGSVRMPYTVTLGLPALTPAQWDKALRRIAQESRFVAGLLAGTMPEGLDESFRESGASLYPRVPKELQTHCTCPDWANPCKHVAAVCYVMAEALDRDPWLLFDLRGKTKEEVLASLQAILDENAPVPAPRKRGRPKKGDAPIADLLARTHTEPEPWTSVPLDTFDAIPAELPEIPIPRRIPSDPAVFTQLGPLPHARIETSLALAALLHRTGQWVQKQIEEGPQDLEQAPVGEGEGDEAVASPFDAPLAPLPVPKPRRPWRHKRRHH